MTVEGATLLRLERYIAAILRRRWLVVALATLVMLAATAGVRFITVTNDYRVLFSADNPQLAAFNALENTYSVSNTALIAIAPREGSVFTREALGAIEELTEAAWRTPYSSRVNSLTNYTHSEALEDDLVVAPLVEDASALSDTDVARIEGIALDAAEIAGRLVAHDGRTTGVAINFILPENPDQAVVEITDYLNSFLEQARTDHPGINYYMTGDVVMNRTFSDATQNDMETLTPIVFLIIIGVTIILLRSVLGTVAIVAVLVFVINTTMGFAGWNGVVFSPTNAGVPIIVMVIAIADSIHIVTSVLLGMRRGLDRNAAIVESIRINAYPVFITSVTTAIGFLSLNASDSPPFHVLGNYVAFGVLCALIYTMTLLPALLSILPLRVRLVQSEGTAFFDRFADFVIARMVPAATQYIPAWGHHLVLVALRVVVLIFGIPRIELSARSIGPERRLCPSVTKYQQHVMILAMALISFILIWIFKSADRPSQSAAQFFPAIMSFGLWGYLVGHVGIASSVVIAVVFGNCRGRYDSFSEQISEGPARGPSSTRGRALRLSHCGPCVMDDERRFVGRLSGVRHIGI